MFSTTCVFIDPCAARLLVCRSFLERAIVATAALTLEARKGVKNESYCWWFRNPAINHHLGCIKIPMKTRDVLHTGAGFLPSTVRVHSAF